VKTLETFCLIEMVLLVLVAWLIGLPRRMDCILKHFDGFYEWEGNEREEKVVSQHN